MDIDDICRDARSYGLDICDGCNIKYCIAHGRRSQHNCNLSALQCNVQMCAAGAFEPQEDAEDTQDAAQHDSDKLELEELDYRWIAAYQDHAMIAVVICTSNEQAEADLSAGLSEMPDGGNGAIVIDCGSDKERAYTMVEEINGRYFPPSAAQTTSTPSTRLQPRHLCHLRRPRRRLCHCHLRSCRIRSPPRAEPVHRLRRT